MTRQTSRTRLRLSIALSACLFLIIAISAVIHMTVWAMSTDSAGGGILNAGLTGEYFTNGNLSGTAAFTRKDVRINFDWGTVGTPGGSIDPKYSQVGPDNWSVRWTGQLMGRFSETYTFAVLSAGGVRLKIRPAGSSGWTTLVDHWDIHQRTTDTAMFSLEKGTAYDVVLEYHKASGEGAVLLQWSSPSTDLEVIDPTVQTGINQNDWTYAYADIIKGARNYWTSPWGGTVPPDTDENGWPKGGGFYFYQESFNQGLELDPLMRGIIKFSFNGKGDLFFRGNVDPTYGNYAGVAGPDGTGEPVYDTVTNTTVGTVKTKPTDAWYRNASGFNFDNTHRDGTPTGPGGFTNFRLMRPTAPDATTTYPETTIFTPQFREAMSHFTVIRHQLIAGLERDWSERTRPSFFNQAGGAFATNKLLDSEGDPISGKWFGHPVSQQNGPSIEYKIMLSNETGRDMMLSIPPLASDDYVRKLALAIKYGTDGIEPYTSPQAHPVYPPLNSNLRVYFEIGNELWNWAAAYWIDYININALTASHVDANDEDFQIINYDHLPVVRHADWFYTNMSTWRFRMIMLRTIQHSNTFRSVFGDDSMMTRIRPLYEWQYANTNGTASIGLMFANDYFNNADGQHHVDTPHPLNYFLWGGGGATYYGAINSDGITGLITDPTFNVVQMNDGYNPQPTGTAWTFSAPPDGVSAAGIYRVSDPKNPGDGIPAPLNGDKSQPWNSQVQYGQQMGYITDSGALTTTFTAPQNQQSSLYAVAFRAVNHGGHALALHVIIDRGTPNEQDVSQVHYTPSVYNPSNPWMAIVASWAPMVDYLSTKPFTAQPGSTHTITIVGRGDNGNTGHPDWLPTHRTHLTAFVGDVRVTSADAIFQGGIPGGGEANGQPAGQNYQNTLNNEVSWAQAFGLNELSYEGGWSLGGDMGGTPLQQAVKYTESRAKDVQALTMNMFSWAGAAVNVLGTYTQWPVWWETYAQQGLLNLPAVSLIQGIDDYQNHLKEEPRNGVLIPGSLIRDNAVIVTNISQAFLTNGGGWTCDVQCFLTWNVLSDRKATYTISLQLSNDIPVTLTLDGDTTLFSGAAQSGITSTVTLTPGLHVIALRNIGTASFKLINLSIRDTTGPQPPHLEPVSTDGSNQTVLHWSSVTGAMGYTVRMSEQPGVYSQSIDVGSAQSYTLASLTPHKTYYFTVTAYGASGTSFPSNEVATIVLPPDTVGTLYGVDVTSYDNTTANVDIGTTMILTPPAIKGQSLVRASGLPLPSGHWESVLAIENAKTQTEAEALAAHDYLEFALAGASGKDVSLSQLNMIYEAFPHSCLALSYSTDDWATSQSIWNACADQYQLFRPHIPLSTFTDLQHTAKVVRFRLAFYQVPGWYTLIMFNQDRAPCIWIDGSYSRAGSAVTTTTALTSSINPSDHAQSVTLTAQVQPPDAAGTVTFLEGTTTLATATLINGTAIARLSTLAPGGHVLTAVYAGDGGHFASTSNALTQTVRSETCTGQSTVFVSVGRKNGLSVMQAQDGLQQCAILSASTVYIIRSPADMTRRSFDAALTRVTDGGPAKYYLYRYADAAGSTERAHAQAGAFVERYPGIFGASMMSFADSTLAARLRAFATGNGIVWKSTDGSDGSVLLEPDQLYLLITDEPGGVRLGRE